MKLARLIPLACLVLAACQPPLPAPVQSAGTRWNASAQGPGARLEGQGRRNTRWVAQALVLSCTGRTASGAIRVQAGAADGGRAQVRAGSDVRLETDGADGLEDTSNSPFIAALRAGRRLTVDDGHGAITLRPPSDAQLDWLDQRCRGGG